MDDYAISIRGLGKRYKIGAQLQRSKTLRDAITNAAATPFRRLRHAGSSSGRVSTIWALRDVSFDVARGEVVGIIGRNGAGKSTLLKILSRITEPTTGEVVVRGRVGSLLEVGTGFHPELTGRENVYLNGAILGMTRAEIRRSFDDIVNFSEIGQFLDTPVKRYSSGMYVRLAFAVAAHLEPEILVVDEVLSVGDAAFQKKCLKKMGDASRGGRTVLFVSHNMTAVRALCTRAVVLEGGGLTFDGPPMQAVAHYLGSSGSKTASRTWDDPERAPGGAGVRCRELRVLNSQGKVSADIDIQEPFSIDVDFDVLEAGTKAGVTLVVFNDQGIMLFSSINNRDQDWHGRVLGRGKYSSTCRIPGDLLNGGEHTVSVLLWTDGYKILAREDEVVRIHVHDTGGVRGDYMGGMGGVMRPSLEWETKQVG